MPYSEYYKKHFEALVDEHIARVKFDSIEDFDAFCFSVQHPQRAHVQYQEIVAELDELRSDDGFDMYVTDKVLALCTVEKGLAARAPETKIPAFTSEKAQDVEKIEEARIAYKKYLSEYIDSKISVLSTMSLAQKKHYIEGQKEEKTMAIQNAGPLERARAKLSEEMLSKKAKRDQAMAGLLAQAAILTERLGMTAPASSTAAMSQHLNGASTNGVALSPEVSERSSLGYRRSVRISALNPTLSNNSADLAEGSSTRSPPRASVPKRGARKTR